MKKAKVRKASGFGREKERWLQRGIGALEGLGWGVGGMKTQMVAIETEMPKTKSHTRQGGKIHTFMHTKNVHSQFQKN